jgi:hypothetical protein
MQASKAVHLIQQTGALDPGSPPMSWGTLPAMAVVESTRKLIGFSSERKVSPLELIKCDKTELIHHYNRMVGLTGQLNPFLPDPNSEDEFCVPALGANATREQCEITLQEIMGRRSNVVDATVLVLRAMNPNMTAQARMYLAQRARDCEWYQWQPYVGVRFEDLSESERITAIKDRNSWWEVVQETYEGLASILLVASTPQRTDIEDAISSWRAVSSYIKGALTYDEIFFREQITYEKYGLEFDFAKRRELLNKLLERRELKLENLIDFQRVALSTADNYSTWLQAAREIFRLAESKNISPTSEAKADAKPLSKSTRTPDANPTTAVYRTSDTKPTPAANRTSDAKPTSDFKQPPDAKPTFHPKQADDSKTYVARGVPRRQDVPMKNESVGRDQCFKCKGFGHWSKECPQESYRTSYGRTIRKPVMNTHGSIEEVSGEESLGDEAAEVPSREEYQAEIIPEVSAHEGYNDDPPVNNCVSLRTVAQQSENFEISHEESMSMPIVEVCIHGLPDPGFQVRGLLDTASNLNFVSSKLLHQLNERIPLVVKKCCLVVQTMNGAAKCLRDVVELQVAVRDSRDKISEFRVENFVVHPEGIPGNVDLLLSSSWVVSENLTVSSTNNKVVVNLPNSASADHKATQFPEVSSCLISVTPF